MANPLHISKLAEQISLNMLSHKETRDFMLTQQSHTQQARDIIPLRFDTCFVAIAKQRERKKKKKKSERLKEQEINSRRDICGDLTACVSSKKALISSPGPRAAPYVAAMTVVTESGAGSSSITVRLPVLPILK